MPFLLIVIGSMLLISSVKNTQSTLYGLIASDFTGANNFIFWMLAILAIGAVGYIPKLKPLSVAFLGLVIMVLFLKSGNASSAGGGVFSQFLQGIGSTQGATPSTSSSTGSATPQQSASNTLQNSLGAISTSALGGLVGPQSNGGFDFSVQGQATQPATTSTPASPIQDTLNEFNFVGSDSSSNPLGVGL